MAQTPRQGWPVPAGGDAPATAADFAALGAAAEKQSVMRFPNDAARSAAIPATEPGMVSFVDTKGYHETVRGTGGPWDLLSLFAGIEPDGTIVGTYAGQPLTVWTFSKAIVTDANGDGIIMPGSAWGSGGLFYAHVGGADTYPVVASTRILSGNLVGRFYNMDTLAASTSIAARGFVLGWKA